MKCFYVRPIDDIQEVTDWLDANKISYNVMYSDNIIFANMDDVPDALTDVANVTDPAIRVDGKWFFMANEQDETDIQGPFKTQHDARKAFKEFISWSGEFVDNG
jgi:hypothetical protein